MTIESRRHELDSAPIHPANAPSASEPGRSDNEASASTATQSVRMSGVRFAQAGRKDSADVIEPTQKLVTVTREKHIQPWWQGGNQADSQTILSPTHDLSVVVPTRNEHANIWSLVESLQTALHGLCVEVIFVDDSDDETPAVIEDAARTMNSSGFQIHLEHRFAGSARAGGLASAVVLGLSKAQADYVAVLDADLQHPPEQLRVLYDQALAQRVDLVVASRYLKGGSYRGLAGGGRRCISVGLKWTARLLFPEHLLRISDPLGGFFLLRRSLLTGVALRPLGYKILLEILLRCPWRQVLEVPYHFQVRAHGQSKANMQQGILALRHMLRLWREVPAAGCVWKISLLIVLNVLIHLAFLHTRFSRRTPTALSRNSQGSANVEDTPIEQLPSVMHK
jgi:glycosyltransferase involved in cell wall biosynthesis